MKKSVLWMAAFCSVAVASCKDKQEPAFEQTTAPFVDVAAPAATVDVEPLPTESASPSDTKQADNTIPAAMRGQWGMGEEDCDLASGAAKGSLTVTDKTLRFYEASATLASVTKRTATSIRATYAFEGEGYEWTREVTLELKDGGKRLVEQQFGEGVSPYPNDHFRCK